MRILKLCALFMSVSLIAASADPLTVPDYKPGWDAEGFYKEVMTCRTALIVPAVNAYTKRGTEAKKPEDEVRRDTIAMLSVFEHVTSESCFCAVNGIAKLKDYPAYFGTGDFSDRMRQLKEQFDLPACSASMDAAMEEMDKDRATIAARRLK